MFELESTTFVAVLTILVPAVAMVLGAIGPVVMEGLAVLKALDGMTRQPEAANDLRGTLIISMALLESTAIYVLLICLVLLFANPALDRILPQVDVYVPSYAEAAHQTGRTDPEAILDAYRQCGAAKKYPWASPLAHAPVSR